MRYLWEIKSSPGQVLVLQTTNQTQNKLEINLNPKKHEPTRQQEARPLEDKQNMSTPPFPHIPDDVHVIGPSGCGDDSDFGGPFQEIESFPEIHQSQQKGCKPIGSFISDDDTDTEGPTDKTIQKRKSASVRGKQLIKGPSLAKKSKAFHPDMDEESDNTKASFSP